MERRPNTASQQTKQALAAALKELMAQKPIENITIHDLTEHCGIRRQTFYYHFEDIYDLLRWLIQEEAISLLRQHEGTMFWQEGLLQLFLYLDANRAFCCCALQSVGRDHIRRFVESDIYEIIHRTIEQVGQELGALRSDTEEADLDLMSHFYVVAFAGIVENWLLGKIDRTPRELIDFVDQILQDHMRGARERITAQS